MLHSGNRVRIAAHMINALTDQSLLTETYEGDLGDVLKLQRDVAESITEKVRAKLTPEQQARLHETPKVDPEAYQAYLIAASIDIGLYQEQIMAREYLQKAIQKDPNFPDAYVRLAWTYVYAGQNRVEPPAEAYPLAKQAVYKALEMDEKICLAHEALGYIYWRYDWDWKATRESFTGRSSCARTMAAPTTI